MSGWSSTGRGDSNVGTKDYADTSDASRVTNTEIPEGYKSIVPPASNENSGWSGGSGYSQGPNPYSSIPEQK